MCDEDIDLASNGDQTPFFINVFMTATECHVSARLPGRSIDADCSYSPFCGLITTTTHALLTNCGILTTKIDPRVLEINAIRQKLTLDLLAGHCVEDHLLIPTDDNLDFVRHSTKPRVKLHNV